MNYKVSSLMAITVAMILVDYPWVVPAYFTNI